jgi:anti-sigma regulatory factor (Ser/Thr protein kinase)
MPAEEKARTNGNAPFAGEHADVQLQLRELQTACRRQAGTIGALGEAVGALRTGARALKAENAGLRAEVSRLHHRRLAPVAAERETDDEHATEDSIALNVDAPAAARAIATATLRGRVPATVLERARLLATELATNSVLHSGAGAEATLIVRVTLTRATVGVEVEDPGHDGTIAPRAGDAVTGRGFGLGLVQTLSESWGLERAAAGGTRVWARLARATPPGVATRFDREGRMA